MFENPFATVELPNRRASCTEPRESVGSWLMGFKLYYFYWICLPGDKSTLFFSIPEW
jgi:hypothetical protein